MTSTTDLFLALSRLSAAIKEVETAVTRLDIAASLKTAIAGLDITTPVKAESKPKSKPSKPSKPAVPDIKANDKPALRIGQTWLKRDKRTVSISLRVDEPLGKSDHYFISSEGVKYAPSGFCQPGRFSSFDLMQLIQDAPDDEMANLDPTVDPVPNVPVLPTLITKPKNTKKHAPPVVAQDTISDIDERTVAEPTEHAAVMLDGFNNSNRYMLTRALAQFCKMTEVQAKSVIDGWPGKPVEVARHINSIHAQNTLNGLTRINGVRASIKMVPAQ